jgi:cytochrome P450
MAADLNTLKQDLTRRMDGAIETLKREFAGLRTGRAHPGLLEPVRVSAYGSEMPLTSEGKRSGTSLLRTLAFSGGQRNCVGQRFAMIEATVMLAILVRDCEFKLPEGHPDPEAISSGVVQKPKAGIQLLVQKRGREL